jgi:cytochrome c-type biogenesis protein CcmH
MNRRKLVRLWLLIALAVLAVLVAVPVFAQQPSADDVNEVAKKLSCPTCTGINVADCPTDTCAQWRAKIGDMLVEGKSEQEILDYFAARYGDHVLQVPPKRGFFVLVWILPVIAIIAGVVWLAFLMRGWSQRSAAATAEHSQDAAMAATSSAMDDADKIEEEEYLQRVQQDLEKLS